MDREQKLEEMEQYASELETSCHVFTQEINDRENYVAELEQKIK